MQKCNTCGADLPENTSFCGKCGSTQDNVQASATSLSAADNEDERRKRVPPWSPLYGTTLGGEVLLGSGRISPPGVPVVQGTPQIGNVPGIASTSTAPASAPTTPPIQGSASAPASPPTQGPGNASISHPVQGPVHPPISHPVQGPVHPPISHPVQGPVNTPHPQPKPEPPEEPGTHKHHRHHKHSEEQEQHEHQNHPARQVSHRAARTTKVAGGSSVKTIILVVTAIVVLVAGGIAAATHFLSHPQPLITITSQYTVGSTPAGASGTVLHISGQQFASNSAITFLLDAHIAPDNPVAHSDINGTFSTGVTITDAWSVGTHTLTVRDASNDSPKNSVSVIIVPPGQANTPGPNGAPPDDATFTLNIPANGRITTVNQPFPNNDEALHISGHPDPAGGTVCLDRDNGQQLSASYTDTNGTPFTESYSFSCQGSYKDGKISFTETLLTDVVTYNDGSGISCTLNAPQLNQQLTGSYTGSGTFTGTWTYGPIPGADIPCTDGSTFFYSADQGTWTGTVSGL